MAGKMKVGGFSGNPVTALTQGRATPAAYEAAEPGKFSMIHFATHATANRESPLDSAIILSPSGDRFKLYGRDVIESPGQNRITVRRKGDARHRITLTGLPAQRLQ